jgi:hypothetical protein
MKIQEILESRKSRQRRKKIAYKTHKSAMSNLMYKGYPCTKDCSGHQAGDNWAANKGIQHSSECPYGSSNSFWEGCKSNSEYK